jgi:hypothetical protein
MLSSNSALNRASGSTVSYPIEPPLQVKLTGQLADEPVALCAGGCRVQPQAADDESKV